MDSGHRRRGRTRLRDEDETLVNAPRLELAMTLTKRPNYEAFELFNAKHADRTDCDQSGFNIVIELDESVISQVAGGLQSWNWGMH
jgi:hypothetical protein